ncbi:hypothetical protein SAMN05444745_1111 [Arthrobacter sp. OV608]|nr:hypothetical protein SAMN05444745_1111 [Arthrobacter sp. OV608]
MFLTHGEFSLIMEGMGERYKAFTKLPVGLPANRGQLIRRLVPAEVYCW